MIRRPWREGKAFPRGGRSGAGGWQSLWAGKPKVSEPSSSMILQIFGPYGKIGIMRMSETGNEAAEGEGGRRGPPVPSGILRAGKAAGSARCSRGVFPCVPTIIPRRFPLAPPLSRCSGRPCLASGRGKTAWARCPHPWEHHGSGSPRVLRG